MNLLASGSMPAEGSSRRIMGGLPRRAMATDSLRLLPPLNDPAGLLRNSDKFSSVIFSSISYFLFAFGIHLILA